ncbi:MAG: hypothetical protein IPK26_08150 [Planctomycetes bacterium]|nr:hypothetical protein [Planctomycetota bacterium]
MRVALLWSALAAGCGGVSYTVHDTAAAPARVAVLPFAGDADLRTRDLARALLVARLRARGFAVPGVEAIDQRLAARGWLADPERFSPAVAAPVAMARELGVDAVIVGTALSESSFNLLAIRRQAFGGDVACDRADGRRYFTCSHTASRFGGFLLMSGQVLAELRAQGQHGTPAQSIALVDEFVEDVAGVLPAPAAAPAVALPLPLGEPMVVRAEGAPANGQRWQVSVEAPAEAIVRIDFEPGPIGVPTAWHDGIAVVVIDLPAERSPTRVRAHAVGRFGETATSERRLP